jgi:3-oxoacyl-[acyl-carrier protein] reductase
MEDAMKFAEMVDGYKDEITHVITRDDINAFVKLTGDDNPVHVKENGIAHGMLTASFISTLIGTKLPGNGSVWVSQSLQFIRPVYENDTITVKAEVHSRREKDRIVVLLTDIFNQNNEAVIFGIASVKLPE